MTCYDIAGHGVAIDFESKADSGLLPSFVPFITQEPVDVVLTVEVRRSLSFTPDTERHIGDFDCGVGKFGVYGTADGGYYFELNDWNGTRCVALQMEPTLDRALVALADVDEHLCAMGLNNAMMLTYMQATAKRQTLLMHSSVVVNDGRGYLFLGPSGTGKSTHTGLWLKHIEGSWLLNDDNPVLRMVDGRAVVYGSPWSGKTPCYKHESAPVGGIVRLEQRPYNKMDRANVIDAMGAMLISVSTVKWERDIHLSVIDTIQGVISTTPIFTLGCLPDEAAARLSYSTLCPR